MISPGPDALDLTEMLTDAIDQFDSVGVQFREARAQVRTARFYDLLRSKRKIGEARAEIVGSVIEIVEGYAIVCWPQHGGLGVFPGYASLRQGLHIGDEVLLSLVDVSERRAEPDSREPQTRPMFTESERDVLIELGHGCTNAEIAERLGLTRSTVKGTLGRACAKLGVHDRVRAALLVRDLGLTSED